MTSPVCPLCRHSVLSTIDCPPQRYYRCLHCKLVFLDFLQRPDPAEERRHYDLHVNHPDDPGYRRFLSRAMQPVLDTITPPASGLDFGCGPGPTLSVMLREHGYECADHDPIYFPDQELLQSQYDFVTCSEVIEHVHQPDAVWPLLARLLKPGGLLVVMTKRLRSLEAFPDWHYRRDPTHVCFYSVATFEWVAARHAMTLTVHGDDVVSLKRH